MGLRNEEVGVRSGVRLGTSSAGGWPVRCKLLKRFGSMDSPMSGRPSIFGACETKFVVDDHPNPARSGEEVVAIR